MSAADDVMEMKTVANRIASFLTTSAEEKQKIAAVRSVFRDSRGRFLLTGNRALEFLRGIARRVDNWEMEHAKRQLREIERLERERRDHAHFTWLDELITSDPRLGSRSAAELQHLLRAGRGKVGAVAQAAGKAAD